VYYYIGFWAHISKFKDNGYNALETQYTEDELSEAVFLVDW
jgi:hypothetical protein